jgi:hypothetical protein
VKLVLLLLLLLLALTDLSVGCVGREAQGERRTVRRLEGKGGGSIIREGWAGREFTWI